MTKNNKLKVYKAVIYYPARPNEEIEDVVLLSDLKEQVTELIEEIDNEKTVKTIKFHGGKEFKIKTNTITKERAKQIIKKHTK